MNIKYWVNKWLNGGLWWQLLFFAIVNILAFGLCVLVYFRIGIDEKVGLWEALRLFVNSNGVIEHTHGFTGRNILLLFTECLGTILFSSLIVSIITNVINSKVDDIKVGHVHYRLKNHVVIIGYDAIVPSIISELIKHPQYANSKIVLQASTSVDDIRNDLLSKLPGKALKRIVMVHAPRQSVEELELLYTVNAKEIYVVGERAQSDHDAENMFTFETLVAIHEKYDKAGRKPITIWFENEASYAALQLNDISADWQKYFEFKPYNFYKRWANRLLTNSDYGTGVNKITYPELDHDGIKADSTKHVHLIIVGMNRMGTALAKEAAHMMHFPNFDEKTGKNRTRITFIDDNADVEMNFFIGRHPGYFDIAPIKYADLSEADFTGFESTYRAEGKNDETNFLDVQFEFIKGRVESKFVREWIRKELEDDDAIITIAICIHNPSQSFGMAMYLPEEVYTRGRNDIGKPWEVADKDMVVNIFVRQEKTGSLIKSFGDAAKSGGAKNKKYANIYPFGMVDDSFATDYYSNHLAMAFNYVYEYYFAYNQTLPSSMPSVEALLAKWKPISTSNKWSNLYLADSIEFKLRSIGQDSKSVETIMLTDEQIEKMAYTEHCRWNMEKLLMGYRPLTDKERKEEVDTNKLKKNMFAHHLIKPYESLSEGDKQLDRNIIKKLPDILRMLN